MLPQSKYDIAEREIQLVAREGLDVVKRIPVNVPVSDFPRLFEVCDDFLIELANGFKAGSRGWVFDERGGGKIFLPGFKFEDFLVILFFLFKNNLGDKFFIRAIGLRFVPGEVPVLGLDGYS